MKLLATVVILGALAGLWVLAKGRLLYAEHLEFDEFRERWQKLPKVETGVRRRD